MIDSREEGVMSFEELMAEGNTLDAEKTETPSTEETVEATEDPKPVTAEEGSEELVFEEEETPPVTEEEEEVKEEEKPKAPEVNTSLTNLKQKYLESGKWDDVVLDIDGEEVQLSELGDIDEDTFLQIQEAQEGLREESNKDKFIPKEGLNETSLKLIELQRNGGDITEAIRIYDEYINPLEGLDLNNERIQEQLVRNSLSKKVDDPEIVEMTIAKYKKDLVLDKKANDVVEFTNQAFGKYMEQKTAEASELKKKEKEAHSKYKSQLEDRYKGVDLKPELKKEILSLADKNDKGEYNAIDLVRQQLSDPELAEELLYFIGNREAFKKNIGAKTKTSTNINTMKTINIVKDKQKKQSSGTKTKEDTSTDFDFIEVPKL